jgi:hypothetical protein
MSSGDLQPVTETVDTPFRLSGITFMNRGLNNWI